jgi:hypothetical protein
MSRGARVRRASGLLASAALAIAIVLALDRRWLPAGAVASIAAAAAYLAGFGLLPWTRHGYVARLARAWVDWNGRMNYARDADERARATDEFVARLTRMRRPPDVDGDHVRLIEAVRGYPSERSISELREIHARFFPVEHG